MHLPTSLKATSLKATSLKALCLACPFLVACWMADSATAWQTDPPADPPGLQDGKKKKQKQAGQGKRGNRKSGDAAGKAGPNGRPDRGNSQQALTPQQRMQRLIQMLRRMDTNGNGVLEKAEVPERMQARWDQVDTDADGQLNREEIAAMLRQMMQRAGQMPGNRGPDGAMPPGQAGADARARKKRGRDQSQPPQPPQSGSVEPVRPDKKNG